MTGQLDNCTVCGLSLDDHWLASCPENADCANPVTWDEEPVYSPATVAEGLFDGGAFEQMKGQTSLGPEIGGTLNHQGSASAWTLGVPMKRSSSTCRLRKVSCPECGYTARIARSWMTVGLPSCPCGGTLEPDTPADRAYCGLVSQDDVPQTLWTAICRENGWEDAIVREGAAGKAWTRNELSHLDARRAGAAHCVFAGCGRWVAEGAGMCSAGHAQHEDAVLEAMPF